jgi:hypothetical protein
MHMRILATLVTASLSVISPAIASNIGAPKPDLTVGAPSVKLSSAPSAHAPLIAQWTVRNKGAAASPPSHLELRCTLLYAQDNLTQCLSLSSIDIPPLAVGDSYTTPGKVAATVEAFHMAGKYRFTLTARVDPNNQIAESDEQNNSATFTAENFQGPAPSNISAAPVAQVAPVMQLATNPAQWDPAKSAWIELKNVGPYDAPHLAVQARCFRGSHSIGITVEPSFGPADEKPCSFVVVTTPNMTASTDVAPIAKGQFKAIYELKSFVLQASANAPAYVPMEVRFHLVGAKCPDLILSNKRR